jgi:hypothetical protein
VGTIEYAVRADPGGKPVDVIDAPRRLWICVYSPDRENDREVVMNTALGLLAAVSDARSPRVRDRELTLWWGEIVDQGEQLRVIGFPQRLLYAVHKILVPLVEFDSRINFGDYEFADTGAMPLVGYDYGRIVAYGDPFAAPADIGGAQLRSAEMRAPSPIAVRRHPMPGLTTTFGPVYSLEGWSDARSSVLDAIYDLTAASSFASLRRMITTDLGITVTQRSGPEFALGRLTAGWLTEAADGDPGCTVGIELRRDMAPELRYVVLAHELAHFVLHFPLLLAAQLVEQASWEMPALENVWHAALAATLPTYEELERNADQLAVNLLIPPRYFPLRQVSAVHSVGGYGPPDPHHLVWHFLQGLFPNTAEQSYSWVNWDEHERRAAAQVAGQLDEDLGGQGLYDRMLGAGLANERGDTAGLQTAVGKAVAQIASSTFDAVTELGGLGPADQAQRAAALIRTSGASTAPHLPRDLSGLAASREILAPQRQADHPPKRLPLVPTRGGRRLIWRSPVREEPAADLATWQAREPERAIVLYREPPPLP